MHVSQELLNQSDEFKSLVVKCLAQATAEEQQQIHRIVMSVYAVSCGVLVVTINQISGNKKKRIVIDTDGIGKLFNDIDTKNYCAYAVSNLRQFHAWINVNVSPLAQVKINKLAHHIHDVLDEANQKLHALLKNRLKAETTKTG